MTYKADASELSYSPAVPTDWDTAQEGKDGDDAFDELAERIKDEETNLVEILDAAGGQTIAGTAATVTMATTRTNTNTSEFAIASSEITLTTAGLTQIQGEVTLGTTGSGDYEFGIWLELDGSEIAGTRRYAGKAT
jgi:cyclophilin family peptidyl-prolyl cis-trans isomerase